MIWSRCTALVKPGSRDVPLDAVEQHRFLIQAGVDAVLWAPALFLATWARYDFQLRLVDMAGIALLTVVAGVAQIVIGSRLGLYIHRWRYGTIDEVEVNEMVAERDETGDDTENDA